ncbi:MAG: Coenzyme F420 hydrogenase/dehydrogenase, beta subunit C-terminal domain [Lachnospiraceae bacterium]|nr:Coenzyme F420 hydrogenase/dehydrogenase, beta subunit C-terminal domain [Lachnospiraceae bacterium]
MKTVSNNCYGCDACYSVCSQNAIEKVSLDGMEKRIIKSDQCIECLRCKKVCPSVSTKSMDNKIKQIGCGWSRNKEVLNIASSGGVFYELARYFIENEGVVVGAIFSHDYKRVKHILTDNFSDVKAMMGSKYVESSLEEVYIQIKNTLRMNRKILFSGTPCQCAAIKNYFANNDLLTYVEVICNGVQYTKVLQQQIDSLQQMNDSEILSYSMRKKHEACFPIYMHALFENGQSVDVPFYNTHLGKIYGSRIALKNSCYSCKFKGEIRCADITLGDYHGFELINKVTTPKMGANTVLINTQKGANLIEKTVDRIVFVEAKNSSEAIKCNSRILINGFAPNVLIRNIFNKIINKFGLGSAAKIAEFYYLRPAIYLRKIIEKIQLMRK